jgi:hypothetical protein
MNSSLTNKKLWLKWTINCALGEILGIGFAGAIAFSINSTIGEPQTIASKVLVLFFMLLAGFIEGFMLGIFQWKVLINKFQKIPKNKWILNTVRVAVLGWFLGMLPSLFFIPPETTSNDAPSFNFDNPTVFALLSIGTGNILGGIFGLFQWFVLKQYVQKAYLWILANALGWGLGLGWIYLFASLPSENTTLMTNIVLGIFGGLLAGITVGGVTGLFFINLKEK